uniref:Uncharacterized protein n=1 Tax=Candidatus Kentrum sp. LPFa TaxID=2126335 RepID=A0A450W1R8_9GAMM|nr:MAG: hypothetical protein BECKLPF1236A_GA0070988_1004411 [Candidatus Kentron sp. LPFa]
MNRVSLCFDLEIKPKFNDPVIPPGIGGIQSPGMVKNNHLNMLARSNRSGAGWISAYAPIPLETYVFPIPNSAKLEPRIFVHYSPVIPLISGNPVTNISLIFLDRFFEDFPSE